MVELKLPSNPGCIEITIIEWQKLQNVHETPNISMLSYWFRTQFYVRGILKQYIFPSEVFPGILQANCTSTEEAQLTIALLSVPKR